MGLLSGDLGLMWKLEQLKRKQARFPGSIGYWFLTVTPGDRKKHCDSPVKVEVYGCQVINGLLAKVQFIVGPLDL